MTILSHMAPHTKTSILQFQICPPPLPSQAFDGHLRRFVSLDGGANFVCLSGWVCANPRAITEFFSIAKDERFYWKHKQIGR